MAASMDSSCMLQAYGPALNGAVPECTGTPQCNTCAPPRGTAERLKNKRLARRALCDREQRGARPIDTVCAVAVVAPGREPYAADRRRSHRVERGRHHSQNAGARWRDREHTRLDERTMARRTSGIALTVGVPDDVPSRTRSRPGGARWRSCSIVGWPRPHRGRCSLVDRRLKPRLRRPLGRADLAVTSCPIRDSRIRHSHGTFTTR